MCWNNPKEHGLQQERWTAMARTWQNTLIQQGSDMLQLMLKKDALAAVWELGYRRPLQSSKKEMMADCMVEEWGGKKWEYLGYTLEVKLTRFIDGLDVGHDTWKLGGWTTGWMVAPYPELGFTGTEPGLAWGWRGIKILLWKSWVCDVYWISMWIRKSFLLLFVWFKIFKF